jgi:hypothetical protein
MRNRPSERMLRALRQVHETIICHEAFIEGMLFGYITSMAIIYSGRRMEGILFAGALGFLLFLLLKELCIYRKWR